MGGNKSKGLSAEDLDYLKRRVSFSKEEIIDWHKEYRKYCNHGRYMTVEQFKEVYARIFDGDASSFAEHVFRTFDHNGDGKVDFKEFLIGLSLTASTNKDKKLKWAFSIMTPTIIKPQDVATPEMITEKLFRKIDRNNDNAITWEEFRDGAMTFMND
ncbi:hypothetical protein KUTeg_016461 [Tegillarca granosa]|uniref:EF-hand domain-containing protein n=1 Tax=Tegillarca granosa TaxID=220873 RepID=A0ABQ9EKX3_TEGGR|nr:hypothetical protein KUTeg_016461 [Tegillarca granosa]